MARHNVQFDAYRLHINPPAADLEVGNTNTFEIVGNYTFALAMCTSAFGLGYYFSQSRATKLTQYYEHM